MAFWTSSARTTAKGVATSAGTSPSSPRTSKVSWRDDTTESSAILMSEVTISSKGTWSPGSRDRISCTMAMERTRRSASKRATRPPPGGSRRACRRSRAEIVCRLFLTRWCTSRMAASLDRRSRSRRRTSVTSRMRTRQPVTRRRSMSGMQWSSTVTSGRRSTSSTTGRAEARAHSMADSSMPSSCSRCPSSLGVEAHAVEGVGGVGRRVADPSGLVDEDHAVTDPRGLLGGHLFAREREGRLGQHDGEAVEDVAVGALEVAGPPTGAEADRRTSTATRVPSHRTGMDWTRTGPSSGSRTTSPFESSPAGEGLAHHRPLGQRRDLAHQVVLDHGGGVGRSHLTEHDHLASSGAPPSATGVMSSRSEKERSASTPQVPSRRCRWASWRSWRLVCSKASSAGVVTAHPPTAAPTSTWRGSRAR